jgi:hypothetical protein
MASTFKYVQGDTGPQLKFTITNADDGAVCIFERRVKLLFCFRAR